VHLLGQVAGPGLGHRTWRADPPGQRAHHRALPAVRALHVPGRGVPVHPPRPVPGRADDRAAPGHPVRTLELTVTDGKESPPMTRWLPVPIVLALALPP